MVYSIFNVMQKDEWRSTVWACCISSIQGTIGSVRSSQWTECSSQISLSQSTQRETELR